MGLSIPNDIIALLEKGELGLNKVSAVVSVTSLGDSSVVCYTLVGAEPHSAHEVLNRVAILYEGRVMHSLIVK